MSELRYSDLDLSIARKKSWGGGGGMTAGYKTKLAQEMMEAVKELYLPANASVLIIGEVVTDPAVDVTQGHLLGRGRVGGVGDERGVTVPWFAILVDCHVIFAQAGLGVHGVPWSTLVSAPDGPAWEADLSFSMVARRVSWGSQSMEVRLLSSSDAKAPLGYAGKRNVVLRK